MTRSRDYLLPPAVLPGGLGEHGLEEHASGDQSSCDHNCADCSFLLALAEELLGLALPLRLFLPNLSLDQVVVEDDVDRDQGGDREKRKDDVVADSVDVHG